MHEHMYRLEETIKELKSNTGRTKKESELEVNKPYHVRYIIFMNIIVNES